METDKTRVVGVDMGTGQDCTAKTEIRLCLACQGTGDQKYMQSAVSHSGKSTRVHDLKKVCKKCGGMGITIKSI